ncbi:universal stress protein [Planomonospora parontospora subsp. parontospora]|uniref:Universal stress protein n=2 Tax=Planomonospora parontospora TaxID=58119 RepID=A0AA37BP02_9ACTN|nr:universal stress protein [Planomonospora parontospora]GGL00954.1 universal stress protein [Planomonospora parontospora]GII13137.1 universal stress protein [Planomonospora parontospora subsp. parontospora]
MIVVGVDGSQAGLEAVGWAVREAGLRGARLRIVHVMPTWAFEMPEDVPHADVGRWMRDGAAGLLAQGVERARAEGLPVEVEPLLLPGDPRQGLIEAAGQAELLVVGSHGLGGFLGMLVGSVALGVCGHTACPVAVVRAAPAGQEQPAVDGPVVVGVDGSPAGAEALAFAFAEASARGVELRAVHAWSGPVIEGAPHLLESAERREGDEQRVLAEALAGWSERYPDVKVTAEAVNGHPVDVLKDASAGAGLLVVGSRGRGDLTGLLLGSVSHSLLHHALCPLAVVPPR